MRATTAGKSRIRLAALAGAVGVVLVVTLAWNNGADAVPFGDADDSRSSRHEVASGDNPIVEPEAASRRAPPADSQLQDAVDPESLGPLEGDDLERLKSIAERSAQNWEKWLRRLQEDIDRSDPTQALEEADHLLQRELALETVAAIQRGDYTVVTQANANRMATPADHAKTTVPCSKAGEPAIAVVLLSYETNQVLRDAADHRRKVEDWQRDEFVRGFNRRDYSSRRRWVDRYLTALKSNPRSPEDRKFTKQVPSGVTISEQDARMQRNPGR